MPFTGNHTLPTNLLDNCDGMLYCVSDWANTVTGGLFWVAVLVAFAMVLFMAVQRFGTARAYGFSSGVTLLASLWLATLQLMPWSIARLFVVAGAIGFAVLILHER